MISDFAIMLVTAGIVTVLFKKLKMPLILGYILAGFIISPYFPLFVNISNKASISAISEVGEGIILFHIGLEFDLHKMANIGSTAIVTALIKMSGVMVVGYLFGHLSGGPVFRFHALCLQARPGGRDPLSGRRLRG